MKMLLPLLLFITAFPVLAGDKPRLSEADPRVRYVTYKVDDVVELKVRRGVVTRIILGSDEKILSSGTGFDARCDKDDLEWCIRADKDSNQIWIKARDRATHNNIEIATDKRDYSFRVGLLSDAPGGGNSNQETYRVIFQYPVTMPRIPAILTRTGAVELPTNPVAELNARMESRPIPRNANYTMDAISGGELVAPSMVFDDGRFTYFRFPNNREIPAFFAIGANNEESRVNLHMEGDIVVVHRLARKFLLRLGKAVAAVYNEAFDSDGISTSNGVVVPDVTRELKAAR
jgi:type IV secretion system protein VirB9